MVFTNHLPVILAIIAITATVTWIAAMLYYKKRVDDLEGRISFRNDEIAHLKRIQKKPTEQSQGKAVQSGEQPNDRVTLTPFPLFYPSYFNHTFLIRDTDGEQHAFDPTTLQAGILILEIGVTFTAIPDVMVEQVFLEIMNTRLPSQWEPRSVYHNMVPDVDFVVPEWINAGMHTTKLIAIGAGFETPSPEFQIDFPARS